MPDVLVVFRGPGNDHDIGLGLTAEPRRAAGERDGRILPLMPAGRQGAGQCLRDPPAGAEVSGPIVIFFTSSPSSNISRSDFLNTPIMIMRWY